MTSVTKSHNKKVRLTGEEPFIVELLINSQ